MRAKSDAIYQVFDGARGTAQDYEFGEKVKEFPDKLSAIGYVLKHRKERPGLRLVHTMVYELPPDMSIDDFKSESGVRLPT